MNDNNLEENLRALKKSNALLTTIVIILMLLIAGGLVYYFCFDKKNENIIVHEDPINDNTNIENDNNTGESDNNTTSNKIELQYVEANDIEISVSPADKVSLVGRLAPNSNIHIEGDLLLNYDESKYTHVGLTGYCLGNDGVKYRMIGPSNGATSFYNSDTRYWVASSIGSKDDVIYPDGTTKTATEVEWDDVSIVSCKIEKVIAYQHDIIDVEYYHDINVEFDVNADNLLK